MRTKSPEPLPSRKAWNEQRAQALIDAIASHAVKGMTNADRSRLLDRVRELGEVVTTVRSLDDGAPF